MLSIRKRYVAEHVILINVPAHHVATDSIVLSVSNNADVLEYHSGDCTVTAVMLFQPKHGHSSQEKSDFHISILALPIFQGNRNH